MSASRPPAPPHSFERLTKEEAETITILSNANAMDGWRNPFCVALQRFCGAPVSNQAVRLVHFEERESESTTSKQAVCIKHSTLQGFKTDRRSSQREYSWTSLAALSAPDPSRRPFGWHTCTFRIFCSTAMEQFSRSDAINPYDRSLPVSDYSKPIEESAAKDPNLSEPGVTDL
ncbi:hypothetical protein A4X13_0g2789 [Tilletia indica]|uniref:Uncharacterized protein n=1 Tax=Tilletia indica TaxID=43049 RepID=A0A8T8T4S0_9BASI|nr:hypothetical protein A4X13_0g2789 [Tilletia indica]